MGHKGHSTAYTENALQVKLQLVTEEFYSEDSQLTLSGLHQESKQASWPLSLSQVRTWKIVGNTDSNLISKSGLQGI